MFMAKISKENQDYITKKIDTWYETAENSLEKWYEDQLENAQREYDRKVQQAYDDDNEEEAQKSFDAQISEIEYKYTQIRNDLNREKQGLDSFVENQVLNRNYDNKDYVIDLNNRRVIEMGGNQPVIHFNSYNYVLTSLPLTVSSYLNISSIECDSSDSYNRASSSSEKKEAQNIVDDVKKRHSQTKDEEEIEIKCSKTVE